MSSRKCCARCSWNDGLFDELLIRLKRPKFAHCFLLRLGADELELVGNDLFAVACLVALSLTNMVQFSVVFNIKILTAQVF